jgi:hypothetical protein
MDFLSKGNSQDSLAASYESPRLRGKVRDASRHSYEIIERARHLRAISAVSWIIVKYLGKIMPLVVSERARDIPFADLCVEYTITAVERSY